MWLVATLVRNTALPNTHMIQIRMRLAFLGVGSTMLTGEQKVTPFENVMKLDLLWAPAAHPLEATNLICTVFRFAFLLSLVSLGSFLIPCFFL